MEKKIPIVLVVLCLLGFSLSTVAGQGNGQSVDIESFAFSPELVSVVNGTTVTWTNLDAIEHTVTADDGSFDSGSLAMGDTFSYTFDTVDTFPYHCSPHPSMTGSVEVSTPPPEARVIDETPGFGLFAGLLSLTLAGLVLGQRD